MEEKMFQKIKNRKFENNIVIKIKVLLFVIIFLSLIIVILPYQKVEINNKELKTIENIRIDEINHLGGYKVSINYDKNYSDSSIIISCSDDDYLKQDSPTVSLPAFDTYAEGAFYISGLKNHGPLQLNVSTQENLEINSITIKESQSFRVFCVIFTDFIILTISVLYLFLSDTKNGIDNKIIITISIFVILIASALSLSGIYYKGYDHFFHELRIAGLSDQIINRTGEETRYLYSIGLNDYNYILPVFYCDLFLLLPALLYNLLVPFHMCYNIYVIVINIFTFAICYYSVKKIADDKWASLIASSFYLLAQHRLYIIYTAFQVGTYTAYAFTPLIILGIYNVITKDKITSRDWLPLSLGIAFTIQSHVISTLMAIFYLILICLFSFRNILKPHKLLSIIKSAITCICLTLWFSVPLIQTKLENDLITTIYKPNILDTKVRFFNYFTDSTGDFDAFLGIQSFAVLALGLITLFLIKDKKDAQYKTLKLSFFLALLTLIIPTNFFPWEIIVEFIPWVSFLQFTRRFVMPLLAMLMLILALSINLLRKLEKNDIIRPFVMVITVFTLLSATNYYDYVKNNFTEHKQYRLNKIYINSTKNMYDYTPINFVDGYRIYRNKGVVYDYDKIQLNYSIKRGSSLFVSLENFTNENVKISVPIVNLSFYRAYDIETGEQIITYDDNGFVGLNIAPNYHGTIKIYFAVNKIWIVASAVSLISYLYLFYCILVKKIKYSIK